MKVRWRKNEPWGENEIVKGRQQWSLLRCHQHLVLGLGLFTYYVSREKGRGEILPFAPHIIYEHCSYIRHSKLNRT